MNTHDIEQQRAAFEVAKAEIWCYISADDDAFAIWSAAWRAAIEADRKQKGVVVVTRTQDGEIVAVTRQDDEGRILSVIAEADRKRRGEPVVAEISDVIREITGCPDIKNGEDSLVVALGMLFHRGATTQPSEPVKGEPSDDRQMLINLMQAFDNETWQCPSCGHAEDTASMDSADMLRRYLSGALPTLTELEQAADIEAEQSRMSLLDPSRIDKLRADPSKADALGRAKARIHAAVKSDARPIAADTVRLEPTEAEEEAWQRMEEKR